MEQIFSVFHTQHACTHTSMCIFIVVWKPAAMTQQFFRRILQALKGAISSGHTWPSCRNRSDLTALIPSRPVWVKLHHGGSHSMPSHDFQCRQVLASRPDSAARSERASSNYRSETRHQTPVPPAQPGGRVLPVTVYTTVFWGQMEVRVQSWHHSLNCVSWYFSALKASPDMNQSKWQKGSSVTPQVEENHFQLWSKEFHRHRNPTKANSWVHFLLRFAFFYHQSK